MTSKERAYKLTWDLSHLGEPQWDAVLVSFPDSGLFCGLEGTEELHIPKNIFFEAHLDQLSDYPVTNVHWPIMSTRMYDIITSAGDFPHRVIPLTMLDASVPTQERFDETGNPRATRANYGYVAVQLTEYSDLFDYHRSLFKARHMAPEQVGSVTRLILREPEESYPPLFRIEEAK